MTKQMAFVVKLNGRKMVLDVFLWTFGKIIYFPTKEGVDNLLI